MIIEKLMMPYILASLHPIMHATCLVTSLMMKYNFPSEWNYPTFSYSDLSWDQIEKL